MTLAEFQAFVHQYSAQFAGVNPIPEVEFDRLEETLGHQLPESLRWLLGEYGYSQQCGIENLDEAVEQTIKWRKSHSLPGHWLILNDWGDGGIVALNLSTGQVCWCDSYDAGRLLTDSPVPNADWFDGYPEWVASRLVHS